MKWKLHLNFLATTKMSQNGNHKTIVELISTSTKS